MLTAHTRLTGNQALQKVRAKSYTITIPEWPENFDLSIALLSDIHIGVGMSLKRLNRIVHAVNDLNCDIIAVLGDMVDGAHAHRKTPKHDWAQTLSRLDAPFGVAAVPGNHDYKGDIDLVRTLFAEANIPLLTNKALKLQKDGKTFWLAGLDSQWGAPVPKGHIRKGHHDIDKLQLAINDDAPVILLMHEPDIFEELPDRFPVAFAGHTHGGQINLPFIGRPLVRAFPDHFRRDLVYGHITSDDQKHQMVVTSGVGCSGIPLRWGVPPEIVRVNLKGACPV